MISNTSDIPTLAGGFINLETIKKPTTLGSRKCKVVCTLGPACWNVDQLETLIDAGMNIARFNFSHGDHEGHLACLNRLREAATNKAQNVGTYIHPFLPYRLLLSALSHCVRDEATVFSQVKFMNLDMNVPNRCISFLWFESWYFRCNPGYPSQVIPLFGNQSDLILMFAHNIPHSLLSLIHFDSLYIIFY
jgi:hypothetical protein